MAILFVLVLLVVCAALAIGWLVISLLVGIIRLLARIIASPFRLAKRADAAVFNRLHRTLPTRMNRNDDVQCTNKMCRARLPNEARFCGRCGGALPARRDQPRAVVVEARSARLSQVA